MGFFSPNFQHEGPGISKCETQKYGVILFFQLLIEKFWILIKLNFLFILFSIPIITIPASIGAMTCITMNLIQRKHVFLLNDFIDKFKENFKQSTYCFIITFTFLFLISFSLILYYILGSQNQIFLILFFISIPIFILCNIAFIYIYPLITTVNLPIHSIIKDSFFLSIVCLKSSILVFIILSFIFVISLITFPISFLFLLILFFSLISFISSFITYPCIKKYIAIEQ